MNGMLFDQISLFDYFKRYIYMFSTWLHNVIIVYVMKVQFMYKIVLFIAGQFHQMSSVLLHKPFATQQWIIWIHWSHDYQYD